MMPHTTNHTCDSIHHLSSDQHHALNLEHHHLRPKNLKVYYTLDRGIILWLFWVPRPLLFTKIMDPYQFGNWKLSLIILTKWKLNSSAYSTCWFFYFVHWTISMKEGWHTTAFLFWRHVDQLLVPCSLLILVHGSI